MPHPITKHVDSCVLIAAFIPDEKDKAGEVDKTCIEFLENIVANEPNSRLRVCFPALGEILMAHLWNKDGSRDESGVVRMKDFIKRAGKKIEPFSPKLVGTGDHLQEAIGRIRDCCDEMHKANVDTTILAYALIDSEAVSLYTIDGHLLQCPKIDSLVVDFRSDLGLGRVKIKPVA